MLSSDLNQEISVSLQKTSHQSSKNEQFWQYISNNMYLHLRGGETLIFASFNSMMCSRIKFRHLPMHLCDFMIKFKKEMMLGKSMQQIYNPLIYLQTIKYLVVSTQFEILLNTYHSRGQWLSWRGERFKICSPAVADDINYHIGAYHQICTLNNWEFKLFELHKKTI